jgi:porin
MTASKFFTLHFLTGLALTQAAASLGAEEPAAAYTWATAATLESVSNLSGGVNKGSRQLGNLDVTLTLDTAAAGWWQNGEWFIYALGNAGKNPSELTGDIQGVSNIATSEAAKIYEFWYQHRFADDQVTVLVGLHDYNSTFYSLDAAGLYTHPSFGIGPDTAQVGPSIFATTALALKLTYEGENQYAHLAVYDGIPGDPENPRGTHIKLQSGDGLFTAAEWGLKNAEDKLGVGIWHHSAEKEGPLEEQTFDTNSGIYVIAERHFAESVAAFVQAGYADEDVNQLAYYFGAGASCKNTLLDGDELGLAVAHARNSDVFLQENPEVEKAETAWELSYLLAFNEQVSSQLSLYYIQNPSMDPTLDDALALGVRLYLNF